jgi:hypothetical protein
MTLISIAIVNTSVYFAGRDSITQSRRASDLCQNHDHLHVHRLFCSNELSSLKGEAQAQLEVWSMSTGEELIEGSEGRHGLQVTGGPPE